MKFKIKTSVVSLIIFLGFSLIWYGLQSVREDKPSTQVIFPSPETSSAILKNNDSRQKYLVSKVTDGDTVELSNGQKVRFVGIDTPETVDPRRSVGCFGKQASNENKKLLEGKEVILEKDVSETDKYNRLLRYVYLPLPDGSLLFINDYLVREGFAKVYTYPPDVKFNEQFLQAEREARAQNRGLWAACPTK